jgi:hypothetical protein
VAKSVQQTFYNNFISHALRYVDPRHSRQGFLKTSAARKDAFG